MRYTAAAFLPALLLTPTLLPGQSSVTPFQPNVVEGGRAVSIAVDPGNSQHLMVASESGGLFSSTNAGLTWTHVDSLASFAVTDVAFAPGNASIAIASVNLSYQSVGDGIWRSFDGGNSWKQPLGAMPAPTQGCNSHVNANSVSFQPGTSNVFVGTDCGLAVSQSLGDDNTWKYVPLDPSVPQDRVQAILALAGGQIYVASQTGFWHSPDSGGHWTKATQPPDSGATSSHAFAVSPFNNTHAFAAVATYELFLSIDGGDSWNKIDAPVPARANRASFVKAAAVVPGALNAFDLFYGDGINLWRQRFFDNGPAPPAPIPARIWLQFFLDHSDPADIGLDSVQQIPVLLATDGGVHTTPGGDRLNWNLTGGGIGGFDALQITEITGSVFADHQDLYYGTQDNDVVGSSDGGASWQVHACCEGFHLRVASQNGSQVTGTTCFGCANQLWDAGLVNQRNWCDAPCNSPQFPNLKPDNAPPIPLRVGEYLQPALDASGQAHMMVTPDFGTTWFDRVTLVPQPAGVPHVTGSLANPSVYQPVNRGCCTFDQQPLTGLVRIDNLLASGAATVTDVDTAASGFGSLGVFPTNWVWYPVFGVDPNDPNHLIIADEQNKEMKVSVDGGQNWPPDLPLTQLVTANGTFDFSVGDNMLVHNITFDPFARCTILVGTGQSGVFQSTDKGKTWQHVSDSIKIGNTSWFYFPTLDRPVLASSYGSGLWQVSVPRVNDCSGLPHLTTEHFAPPTIIDPLSGVQLPFHDIGNPEVCGLCQYIVVKNGRITDLGLNGFEVTKIYMSGGSIHQLDRAQKELALQVPNTYSVKIGSFGNNRVISSHKTESQWIRGLVLERNVLRGFIISQLELHYQPKTIPYVRLFGTTRSGGPAGVETGGQFTLMGEGFAASQGRQSQVRVKLASKDAERITQMLAENIPVNHAGKFSVMLKAPGIIGAYSVIVEQQQGRRLAMTKATLLIVPVDVPSRLQRKSGD